MFGRPSPILHALWLIPVCGFGGASLFYGFVYFFGFILPQWTACVLFIFVFFAAPLFALWFLNRRDPLTERIDEAREKEAENNPLNGGG